MSIEIAHGDVFIFRHHLERSFIHYSRRFCLKKSEGG